MAAAPGRSSGPSSSGRAQRPHDAAAPRRAPGWRSDSSLVDERHRAEGACRAALTPKQRAHFDQLLALAQKYARIREEQVLYLTLGWPLLRRALARLGDSCVRRGVIGRAEDVYFLERDELLSDESRVSSVAERRMLWARHRKLCPPLVVGTMPRFVTKMQADAFTPMRSPAERRPGIRGDAGQRGRVRAVARVILDLADTDRLGDGEILVTSATTPAWTPLFARAAAVVTDGGSLAAHASLVAREYGIPAVVALVDATQRIRDGQSITVDGSAGLVDSTSERGGSVARGRRRSYPRVVPERQGSHDPGRDREVVA